MKENILLNLEKSLSNKGYRFERKDLDRPWGGLWVIDANQKNKFIQENFPDLENKMNDSSFSAKILMVTPDRKRSWQNAKLRAEVWKVLDGLTGVIRSKSELLEV